MHKHSSNERVSRLAAFSALALYSLMLSACSSLPTSSKSRGNDFAQRQMASPIANVARSGSRNADFDGSINPQSNSTANSRPGTAMAGDLDRDSSGDNAVAMSPEDDSQSHNFDTQVRQAAYLDNSGVEQNRVDNNRREDSNDSAPAAQPVVHRAGIAKAGYAVASAGYDAFSENVPSCAMPAQFTSLPQEAYTGYEGDGYTCPAIVPNFMQALQSAGMELTDGGFTDPSVKDGSERREVPVFQEQTPAPISGCGPWKPAGISAPWPEDEYIFDGGDSDGGVKVRADGTLLGLDSEDTVAHYETLDGRICVKPTNRVCLYAPRFSAVRQVTSAYGENQLVRAGGVHMPLGPERQDKVLPVNTALQPISPVGETDNRSPITFKDHTPPVGLIAQTVVRATVDRLKPYENLVYIRTGLLEEDEMPFLAKSCEAAIAWTLDQGVEVTVAGKKAVVLDGDKKAQATYSIEPPKHPCLRVCKIASTPSALPGEVVDFTIRFDNVGDQTVGNVTIADNLTTRLELVPGSGQSTKHAKFFSEPNKEGSLILHWDINEPLKPGEGGICRFRCIVR
ncbi:MAG TPA: hypothetical protein VGJ15_03380 [Pirellulales bacterium]|jgi:uncharacterized repeat protein (TIGR01451 family)